MHHVRGLRTLLVLALLAAIAAAGVACFDDDDGSPVPVRVATATSTATTTATGTAAATPVETSPTATAEATAPARPTATATTGPAPATPEATASPEPTSPPAEATTAATATPDATATPRPTAEPLAVRLEEVFGGREFDRPIEVGAYPVGPAGSGPGLFVAEQEGRILVLHPDGDDAVELLDISEQVSRVGNEEGLLSVALDPRFDETGHLWVYYSVRGTPRMTRLARFTVDPGDPLRVEPGSELVILEVEQPYSNHNGGAIRFGPDGMLYLGYGDGGSGGDPRGHGQNLATLLGAIIRIDVRFAAERAPYAIPAGNPFLGIQGARPEIWAYGLRNPWRMAFDPVTGDLWAADVGQREVEEIDRIEPGGNYGWNILEGTRCFQPEEGCDARGTVLPVAEYGHNLGCSVTGGVVYRGEAIPALVGHYLFADYCSGRLWAMPVDGGAIVELDRLPAEVASLGTDADGEVYVLTFGGAVLRIVP
ncbi:MAG: PQQ-dependent sugar dehydrogenase [Chloroflexi bacterium]|nr:PQQ-dependent sugar dehydrogenase [Chloroflexota bacterium]